MLMLKFYLVLLMALAATANAGAWPRGKGNGFSMTSVQATAHSLADPAHYYFSSYAEYGLTRKITLGGDIGHSVSGESKLILFLRHPVLTLNDKHHFAFELGAGVVANDAVIRPGASYGSGFSRWGRSGWFAIDILFEHHIAAGSTDFKADVTYGLNHPQGYKSIFQIQSGKQVGDPSFLRFAPSVAIPISSSSHLELGGTINMIGAANYGLKIGVWKKF